MVVSWEVLRIFIIVRFCKFTTETESIQSLDKKQQAQKHPWNCKETEVVYRHCNRHSSILKNTAAQVTDNQQLESHGCK